MENNLWLLIIPSLMMLIGVTITAYFGYRGTKRVSETKASNELVAELKDSLERLREKFKIMEGEFMKCKASHELLTDENIMLMKRLIMQNK